MIRHGIYCNVLSLEKPSYLKVRKGLLADSIPKKTWMLGQAVHLPEVWRRQWQLEQGVADVVNPRH